VVDFLLRAVAMVPNLCLGTDLMVGFPGESEEEFQETCHTFLEHPFAYCHVFSFSERDGTPAARMTGQVPIPERNRRSAHLRRLSSSKRYEFNECQVGRVSEVLFENPRDEFWSGYTENYVRVAVPRNGSFDLTNRLARVRLLRTSADFLEAEVVEVLS
ncbi:MAG: hypothetical protein VCA36_13700, partial [Opitutales bacterium]